MNLKSICATVSTDGKTVAVMCTGGFQAKAAAAKAKTAAVGR